MSYIYTLILIFIISQPRLYFLVLHPHKIIKINFTHMLASVVIFIACYILVKYVFYKSESFNVNDEGACKYVCSRGFIKRCDVKSTNLVPYTKDIYNYDWAQLKSKSTVYVPGSAIPAFIQSAYPKITVPFVLVSGDCDETIVDDVFPNQEEFKKFIEDPRVIHWFSQNAVTIHPKLSIIPIGMPYHATIINGESKFYGVNPVECENELLHIIQAAPKNKHMKCYANFHFTINTRYGNDRKDAIDKVPASCVDYETQKIDTYDTWRKQSQYNFVISPHGNGYDCHRTWEALMLGIIPIVKTSPIDRVFEDLPVLIVKDWSDITEDFLKTSYNDIAQKKASGHYDMNKLTLDYWFNIIKSKTK